MARDGIFSNTGPKPAVFPELRRAVRCWCPWFPRDLVLGRVGAVLSAPAGPSLHSERGLSMA